LKISANVEKGVTLEESMPSLRLVPLQELALLATERNLAY
jgi:hypothetical protein